MTFNERLLDNYKTYCGGQWEIATRVLDYLLLLGLDRDHSLIDVGCGPLRIGKHLITYLNPGKYTGIEPEGSILQVGIACELSSYLRFFQKPTFLQEPLGKRNLTADWALGWDIFNHLSPAMLRLALRKIHARWLINIHFAKSHFTELADGQGWSYRYADTKACVYTVEQFKALIQDIGYEMKVIDAFPSGWEDYQFTVVALYPCSTQITSSSSTSREPEVHG